jgi:hypothetical protein
MGNLTSDLESQDWLCDIDNSRIRDGAYVPYLMSILMYSDTSRTSRYRRKLLGTARVGLNSYRTSIHVTLSPRVYKGE